MKNSNLKFIFPVFGVALFGGSTAFANLINYWPILLSLVAIVLANKVAKKIPFYNDIVNRDNIRWAFILTISLPLIAAILSSL